MNSMTIAIRHEIRVAVSRRAQPVWFRVCKWTCIVTGIILFHQTRWFWACLAALAAAGTLLHLLYRRKTKTWTQPWGGWNDLAAIRG